MLLPPKNKIKIVNIFQRFLDVAQYSTTSPYCCPRSFDIFLTIPNVPCCQKNHDVPHCFFNASQYRLALSNVSLHLCNVTQCPLTSSQCYPMSSLSLGNFCRQKHYAYPTIMYYLLIVPIIL